jgi:two-component system sensor histidine kinase DesK
MRAMSRSRDRRIRVSPRGVVLGTLLLTNGWALVFPLRLARPPSAGLWAAYAFGLALFAAALALVLRAAVTPAQSERARLRPIGLLLAVCLALWAPAFAWAEPGEEPWAWMAGFAIGATALAVPRAGVAAAAGLAAMAAIGAAVFEGAVVANLAVALGAGAVTWLAGVVLVWLLGLLWAAEAGRDAQAGLVLAQERLRASRELHDVLGHQLGIIALKAELAAELAATDPERSRNESEEIRAIAATTLADARRALHGETVADLATQLASAELVLRSAGIDTTVDVDTMLVPAPASRLLAAVVREAVTNVLRHSDARSVSIAFHANGPGPTLAIVNDGTKSTAAGSPATGTGLASLAARCAAEGARLAAGPIAGGRFEVTVELTPGGGGS